MSKLPSLAGYGDIHTGIVDLLETARRTVARSVNALMTASYWEIGRRIVVFEQGGEERASYGEALIKHLAVDLTRRFGRGFSRRNIEQMRQFYLNWPIAQTLSAQSQPTSLHLPTLAVNFPLPWSAYVRLLSVQNPTARTFYETEALRSGWSVRQLDRQIGSQFFERIALSRNKSAMLEKAEHAQPGDTMLPEEAIKDPFVLEFLDLKDEYTVLLWRCKGCQRRIAANQPKSGRQNAKAHAGFTGLQPQQGRHAHPHASNSRHGPNCRVKSSSTPGPKFKQ